MNSLGAGPIGSGRLVFDIRSRDGRNAFARSGTDFVAGAELSQGQVQIRDSLLNLARLS